MHRLRPLVCSPAFASGARRRLSDVFITNPVGVGRLQKSQQAAAVSHHAGGVMPFRKPCVVLQASATRAASACFSASATAPAKEEKEPKKVEPHREYAVPRKRQYQSAPKRQHGATAGWRKFNRREKDTPPKKGEEKRELREVTTQLKEVRVSPWQLNLLAKMVRGLNVTDAMAQMQFNKKKHTTTVTKLLQNGCNLAGIRYELIPEQLTIAEIFVTKGRCEKRMRIMGRGRVGMGSVKWSHIKLTLREIDFDDEINNAPNKTRMQRLKERRALVEKQVWKAQGMTDTSSPVEAVFADV